MEILARALGVFRRPSFLAAAGNSVGESKGLLVAATVLIAVEKYSFSITLAIIFIIF
jgi:hypothetical protein